MAAVVAGFGAVYVAIPGMLGTMLRLFTGISQDDSALSRTDSYDLALQFIERSPVFGRGFSTFLPSYRILDNQYLGLLIEAGVVGTLAFLALLVTALVVAFRLSSALPETVDRSLARALAACIAAAGLALATFDAFGFPQVAGVLFFAIGCVTALRRLTAASLAAHRAATASGPLSVGPPRVLPLAAGSSALPVAAGGHRTPGAGP
ncbi:O-antigen ligase family protein [Cellulomonas soli]